MANNSGKLARSRSSTLKLLGSNHCADDPMKGLDPPDPNKHKAEKGGKGRGRKKGHQRQGAAAGPGMHVVPVVSGQLLFHPYHSPLSYIYRMFFEGRKSTSTRGCCPLALLPVQIMWHHHQLRVNSQLPVPPPLITQALPLLPVAVPQPVLRLYSLRLHGHLNHLSQSIAS